jgi:hypothetical protein
MYNVVWKDESKEFVDLGQALAFSQTLNCFVTINGNGMEIVGIMGSDSVEDGKLPDGTDYSWYKRRIPT